MHVLEAMKFGLFATAIATAVVLALAPGFILFVSFGAFATSSIVWVLFRKNKSEIGYLSIFAVGAFVAISFGLIFYFGILAFRQGFDGPIGGYKEVFYHLTSAAFMIGVTAPFSIVGTLVYVRWIRIGLFAPLAICLIGYFSFDEFFYETGKWPYGDTGELREVILSKSSGNGPVVADFGKIFDFPWDEVVVVTPYESCDVNDDQIFGNDDTALIFAFVNGDVVTKKVTLHGYPLGSINFDPPTYCAVLRKDAVFIVGNDADQAYDGPMLRMCKWQDGNCVPVEVDH